MYSLTPRWCLTRLACQPTGSSAEHLRQGFSRLPAASYSIAGLGAKASPSPPHLMLALKLPSEPWCSITVSTLPRITNTLRS